MNESSNTPDTCSDQQTLPEVIRAARRRNSRPEVILRIEPDGRYLRFARKVDRPLSFMVNHSDARRVLDNRGGFDGVIDRRHKLYVTATEKNKVVANRDRWTVFDFLAEFDREVTYTPDWGWVSKAQEDPRRLKAIGRYVDRVEWLSVKIEEHGLPVTLRPLLKGLNAEHFRESVARYRRLDINEVAIYGVETPSNRELVTRTEQAILALDLVSVMVIGRGSPRQVAAFPRRVNAIASWRNWMDASNFSADYYSKFNLLMWIQRNRHALQQGHEVVQTDLNLFDGAEEEVTADG